MKHKRIALCWLNENNLGDVVIRDCVAWLLERCVPGSRRAVKVVAVDIGGSAGRTVHGGTGRRVRQRGVRKRIAAAVRVLSAVPFLRKPLGALADVVLMALWRRSTRYRSFAAVERPKLNNVDAILFAGGGLVKFERQDFNYMLFDITELADCMGVPVYVNAAGVEGFDPCDPECRLLRVALNRRCVKSVTTRDDLELLTRAYIDRDGIEVARVCDPALWAREVYGVERRKACDGVVGINVVRLHLFTDYGVPCARSELLRLYVELVRSCVERGWRVVLFTNGGKSDGRALAEVASECRACIPSGKFSTEQPESSESLVSLIAGFERFVAVRLHASIIGVSLGVPNVSLVWNRKQPMFGNQVGTGENYLSVEGADVATILTRLESATGCEIDGAFKASVRNNLERIMQKVAASGGHEA